MESLSLQHLEQRRESRRISLLLYILANEEHYPALSSAYEDENKVSKVDPVPNSYQTPTNNYC